MNYLKEQNLVEIEAFWNQRMCQLVTDGRLDDADALYLEYCVDGEEPEDWLFLEDVGDVC